MNKFTILTFFVELWYLVLEFDQKVKVWLFSIQLTFDQLTAKFICQSNGLAMFWTMSLGQNDAMFSKPIFELILKIPLGTIWKVPWSWVKILTKLGQNFTKCLVSWSYVLEIITWDPSTFEEFVWSKVIDFMEIYNFHVEVYLESSSIMVKNWL